LIQYLAHSKGEASVTTEISVPTVPDLIVPHKSPPQGVDEPESAALPDKIPSPQAVNEG